MKKMLVSAAALAMSFASAQAAVVNVAVEGGGTPVVYQLDNGNLLGLLGFDARGADGDNVVNLPNFEFSIADITGLITSGGSQVAGYYFGPNFPTSALQNSAVGSSYVFSVADEARLFDSLWVEWSGDSSLVFGKAFGGGTTTLGNTVTQLGAAPIGGAVPEPSTWALLILGFGAIGGAMRRRVSGAVRGAFA